MYDMTPSDILDFTYCKRRWYFHHIENIHNDNHILLVEGTKAHETVDEYHKTIRNGIVTITGLSHALFMTARKASAGKILSQSCQRISWPAACMKRSWIRHSAP